MGFFLIIGQFLFPFGLFFTFEKFEESLFDVTIFCLNDFKFFFECNIVNLDRKFESSMDSTSWMARKYPRREIGEAPGSVAGYLLPDYCMWGRGST